MQITCNDSLLVFQSSTIKDLRLKSIHQLKNSQIRSKKICSSHIVQSQYVCKIHGFSSKIFSIVFFNIFLYYWVNSSWSYSDQGSATPNIRVFSKSRNLERDTEPGPGPEFYNSQPEDRPENGILGRVLGNNPALCRALTVTSSKWSNLW